MEKQKKFKICRNKGFHITFENGWTVSVQFGCCNYSDNYNDYDFEKEMKGTGATSDTAEIWCWNDNDKHYPEDPTYKSTPEEMLKILNKIQKRKKITSKNSKANTLGTKRSEKNTKLGIKK